MAPRMRKKTCISVQYGTSQYSTSNTPKVQPATPNPPASTTAQNSVKRRMSVACAYRATPSSPRNRRLNCPVTNGTSAKYLSVEMTFNPHTSRNRSRRNFFGASG